MASSFPGGLDSFTNPTATDTLDSATVPHADQHANANDAIEAIESTLGVNPQGGSATVVARLTALDSTVAGKAGLSLSNVFTVGAQAIRTGADAVKGLIIQRFSATQSANLLSILQSDGSTEIARIRPNGQVGVGSSSSTAATNSLLGLDHSYAGDQRSIAIKQIASPTQDVIQVQPNASTTPIFKVDSAGAVTASNVTDSALTTAGIVTNTSAGLLGTVATVPVTSGGTGVTTSTGTGNTVRSASPTFTGIPTTPTAAVGTSNFQIASTAFVIGQASATTPAMDSTAAVGTSTRYARADHVHPSDTSKVDTTDSRLSDARTPTAHASTHGVAGSDPVTVASSQVTGLATSATTDTTNADNITSGTLPNARLVAVPNSALANSSVTVNGSAISLGGSATVTAVPSGSAGGDLTGTFPSPTLVATGTAGTYTKVTTDAQGRVTSGTTLLLSDLPAGVAKTGSANAFTVGGHTITNASDVIALNLKGVSGQTVDILTVNNNAGTLVYRLTEGSSAQTGHATFGSSTLNALSATLSVQNNVTTRIGAVVRGAASQTANLQEWQNSAATPLSSITSAGAFVSAVGGHTITNAATGIVPLAITGIASQTVDHFTINTAANKVFSVNSAGRTQINGRFGVAPSGGISTFLATMTLSDVTGSTDLLQLQTSASTIIGGRNLNAQIYSGSTTPITSGVGGATTAASGTGTTATLTMTSATNLAVGDLIVVAGVTPTGYNTTGAVVTAVSNTSPFTVSYANTTTGSQTVAGTVSTPAQASVTARSAGTKGLVIKGVSGQAANLLELQSSAATTTTIDASGNVTVSGAIVSTGSVIRSAGIGSSNSALSGIVSNVGTGHVVVQNVSAVPNTPSGGGVIYVEAGALKYKGSSGTITTIANA